MNRHTLLLAAAALLLATPADTLSWALGQSMGESVTQGPIADLDRDLVRQAMQAVLDGKASPLTDEQYQQAIARIAYEARRQQAEQTMAVQAERAQAVDPQAAEQRQTRFLDSLVAANPNVRRHPDGFCYEVLHEGNGPKAEFGKRFSFHYRSYLMLTGQPFDQTYGKREPITTVIDNHFFPGLNSGIQLMRAGSTYRFYFPYQLAFGVEGNERAGIPPCTPMTYDIEVLEVYND